MRHDECVGLALIGAKSGASNDEARESALGDCALGALQGFGEGGGVVE